ncbi:flagellar biosynthetic protein FliO [Helicobacter magdeburgensis]|uniref:flagellar biosynthetic protein FliO n=1 Tax=Helicobacter magdeburgensis TaxID=471858 RepID=UPI000A7662B3|nr:flagellar biosynthetic protein FliO [Helicobacter magdeburgensis]
MRIFAFVLLCFVSLYGADSNVAGIEFSQKQDSVEVLLYLESGYENSPRLTEQDGYKGVIFPNLQAKSKNQSLKNSFISEVQVFNIQNDLYVIGVGDVRVIGVNVSKSSNAIKVVLNKIEVPKSELDTLLQTPQTIHKIPNLEIESSQNTQASTAQTQLSQNTSSQAADSQNPLAFKTDMGIDTWRYVAVLLVMAALVLVLFYVKRYVVAKGGNKAGSNKAGAKRSFGGYFSSFAQKQEVFDPTKIEVVSQKNLDSKHRILTIESNGYRYLILIGATSTTLIDRYPIPQSISTAEQLHFDDQFAKLLEQKQERLSKYLHNSQYPNDERD